MKAIMKKMAAKMTFMTTPAETIIIRWLTGLAT